MRLNSKGGTIGAAFLGFDRQESARRVPGADWLVCRALGSASSVDLRSFYPHPPGMRGSIMGCRRRSYHLLRPPWTLCSGRQSRAIGNGARNEQNLLYWGGRKGVFRRDIIHRVLVHLRTTVRMWAADASRVGLVSDWKRLKLKHMCFAVCRSSVRERAFSGPKSPDAPEPPCAHCAIVRAFPRT